MTYIIDALGKIWTTAVDDDTTVTRSQEEPVVKPLILWFMES